MKLYLQRRACANTQIKNTPKTDLFNYTEKTEYTIRRTTVSENDLDFIHVLNIRRAPDLSNGQYNTLIGVTVELIVAWHAQRSVCPQ